MNQMTSYYDSATVARLVGQASTDLCDHVLADPSKAIVVHRESDSFGPVGDLALCKECDDAAKAEKAAEVVICPDCHKEVKVGDTRTWKWYDFYAAQGDEPLVICRECWQAPRHQSRMARDAQARDEELGLVEQCDED